MKKEHAQRRLAAILAADVVGYTRLMEADEDATMSAWWMARENIIDPTVAQHQGRIVKHTGDGFLAEFPTATSAVRCAAAMQTALADSNQSVESHRRLDFRMGINIGDIIVDDEDIYGDGVNISARLESLAEPGGICVSAAVYEQVKKRVELDFRDMGEKNLKHIADPVRYYQHDPGKRGAHRKISDRLSAIRQWFSPLRLAVTVAVVLAVGYFGLDSGPGSVAGNSEPPVIAVMPFDTIGAGDTPRMFSQGLTEELLVALSTIPGVRVISQEQDGKTAGAIRRKIRYRIEGSVRSDGNRVGISAKLVDSATGIHLWGGRYDRILDDVLGVQFEVADKIVGTLAERLAQSEAERLAATPGTAGTIQRIIYRGLAQLGRFVEMATILPQNFMDWVSGPSAAATSRSNAGNREPVILAVSHLRKRTRI